MSESRLQARVGTLRQLEILLAVYHHGSISEAARQLHLTQPTVSMQLRKLSDGMSMPLYYQVGRQLQLTEAGHAAVKTAIEVQGCFERLDMKLAGLQGLTTGTLNLAIVTTAKYFIPHLIGDFSRKFPQIDGRFHVGNRQQIIKRLRSGEEDFYVFSHPPESDALEMMELLPNRLQAIAPLDHVLAQRAEQGIIPLIEFCQAPFLMREEGSGTRHAIEMHLAKQGLQLNIRMTIESNEAIKHSVMSGLGVSILSEHTLAFGERQGLAVLDVDHLPIISHWYLAWLKDKPLSPVAAAFLNYIKQSGREQIMAGLDRRKFEFEQTEQDKA
jgi:DNA-binding transcriptional LysR family regulator